MKTFEERYTAWIDGQLAGHALTAFEQELARRAEAGDAETADVDKSGALQLRALLKEHLQAPTLNNTEFFSHQMRDRIDTEIDRAARLRETTGGSGFRFPTLAWPFGRLASVGAACLFVAGALYYGMLPAQHQDSGKNVAVKDPAPSQTTGEVVANNSLPVPAPAVSGDRPGNNQFVKLETPTPAPIDLNNDDKVHVAPDSPATPLQVGGTNVLWLNNPPTLPNVSSDSPSPAPAPDAAP